MSKEEIKKIIETYIHSTRVEAVSSNFFKKKFPKEDVQSVLDEMVADGEVGLRVTYECANCSQRDPRMYTTEEWDEELIYFMCLQCGSEYENDECACIDEIIYYCKPKEEE